MRQMFSGSALALALLLAFSQASWAGVLSGRVVHIADGDTLTVRDSSNRKHRVRLYGIDCPESGQEYGQEATRHATSLAAGKMARVIEYDQDRYGRVVGVVLVEGTNVNQSLVENGYAWKYGRYCKAHFCSDWRRLEDRARLAGLGLWAGDAPVAPWDWRKGKRRDSSPLSGLVAWFTGGLSSVQGYSANAKSRVFHDSDCRYFGCENCVERFSSREQVIQQGYVPCGICTP